MNPHVIEVAPQLSNWVSAFGVLVALVALLVSYGAQNEARKLTVNDFLDRAWDALGGGPHSIHITDFSDTNIEAARRDLRNAQTIAPQDPRVVLLDAAVMQLDGDPEAAEKILRKAIEHYEDDYALRYNLAVVLRNQGKFDEAVRELYRSARIEPSKSDPFFELGNIARRVGNQNDSNLLEDAIGFYALGLQINPNDAQIYHEMGKVFMLLRQDGPGRYAFGEAVRLDPQNVPFRMSLAISYLDGDYLYSAAQQFNEVIRLNPGGSADPYYWLSTIYLRQNDFDSAEIMLEETIRINPIHARARSDLSKLLSEEHDGQEAISRDLSETSDELIASREVYQEYVNRLIDKMKADGY